MISTFMGQFGVGFLSCFLVADRVEVFTKSMNPDAIGYAWKSKGYFLICLRLKCVLIDNIVLGSMFMKY